MARSKRAGPKSRPCSECRKPLTHCQCETWWRDFQLGVYESQDAHLTGRKLKPLKIAIPAHGDAPRGFGRIAHEALLIKGVGALEPVCPHPKLKRIGDNRAVCWTCGDSFVLEELAP